MTSRLQSARTWISQYEGNNIIKTYRQRYCVDWLCAINELEKLGVVLDAQYVKALKSTVESKLRAGERKRIESQNLFNEYQDDHFGFIVGYIEGGAPYGVTWDEMELKEESFF